MQHSKSYIKSERLESALGHLYDEIEALARKVRELEDEVEDLKNK